MAERLAGIRERMLRACERCGRDPAGVRLVAVSKTVEPERIRQALACGVALLGENYIQEAREKIPIIDNSDISWHYIGHLQTNKAKYAAALFDMVHSLDSLPLAHALDREAGKRGRVLPVLVQVNVSGEQSKSGCEPGDAAALIAAAAGLQNLLVRGLMTMPPISDDPEQSRPFFRALRRLRDDVVRQLPGCGGLPELSMGMSADFEAAIEEGATLVRVGTLLFGERSYI
ncbi:MAG: YggS family pyridoxal phosphate-dependent enzyme [Deltaproteobacteria bacterium]|nr:YggS family pyridoxal phosphate-dependent enzyme [Deltaproteobacteria bacterium]